MKEMPHNVDARLTLASLLFNGDRHDDAIALLSPPDSGTIQICPSDGICFLSWF